MKINPDYYLDMIEGYADGGIKMSIIELANEVKRLRDALEFYADESNYDVEQAPGEWQESFFITDMGQKARDALETQPIASL